MKILDMPQNTRKWHKWRKQGIGASDAAAILGVSPWSSKSDWLHTSLGLKKFEGNARTKRGERLEPYVRKLVEQELCIQFRPVCIEHDDYPWLRASLDGLSLDNDHILEIKCPNDNAHIKALSGGVPDYYYPQTQHQFLVSGLSKLTYASYSDEDKFKGEELALVKIEPNYEYMAMLLTRLEEANKLKEKAIKLLKDRLKKLKKSK